MYGGGEGAPGRHPPGRNPGFDWRAHRRGVRALSCRWPSKVYLSSLIGTGVDANRGFLGYISVLSMLLICM
jgi:hypothetical protein